MSFGKYPSEPGETVPEIRVHDVGCESCDAPAEEMAVEECLNAIQLACRVCGHHQSAGVEVITASERKAEQTREHYGARP